MTPEEIQNLIDKRIMEVLGDYSKIPLEVENALLARGFIKDTTGITGTVYVAASSGGAVTTAITFTNGRRTT